MQTEAQKILIIGATSAIAQEVARIYARRQSRLCLVARNQTKLRIVADDLRARGAQAVDVLARELARPDTHADIIEHALAFLQDIDVVLIAYGSLPDQAACEADAEQSMNELQVNFLSVAALLTRLANTLEQRGHGTLAVISSVAGDRGRQSNYVYGAAKGGLSIFLQG
ncbi:MAG TPA: SDR family NAD(P)-dependent oxidoreductase, partial [Gammaproteobacteria bacterium]|nr:SDR family NAD(P)-dependent oxidoreductase [Gammaproteobacteria bacterium]